MNFFLRICCCITLLVLSACVIHQKNVINPQNVAQCRMICAEHMNHCTQTCKDNCSTCSAMATHSSTMNFLEYIHEKQVVGGYITRGLKSYRDALQCRKVSCNCLSDLITCNQGCTGIIQKRLQTTPSCT